MQPTDKESSAHVADIAASYLTKIILRSRKTSLQDMAYLDVTQFVQILAFGRKQL